MFTPKQMSKYLGSKSLICNCFQPQLPIVASLIVCECCYKRRRRVIRHYHLVTRPQGSTLPGQEPNIVNTRTLFPSVPLLQPCLKLQIYHTGNCFMIGGRAPRQAARVHQPDRGYCGLITMTLFCNLPYAHLRCFRRFLQLTFFMQMPCLIERHRVITVTHDGSNAVRTNKSWNGLQLHYIKANFD